MRGRGGAWIGARGSGGVARGVGDRGEEKSGGGRSSQPLAGSGGGKAWRRPVRRRSGRFRRWRGGDGERGDERMRPMENNAGVAREEPVVLTGGSDGRRGVGRR